MSNEVFNDVRKCDECGSSFLLATESADYIEGKPNPDINDETYEGLFCYECISKLEKRHNYLLVWSEKNTDWYLGGEKLTDHYSHHETKKQAQKAYKRLLDIDSVYSASICAVVESTDYV